MKKWIIGLVIAALLVLTVGSIALAQEETPAAPGDWVPGTRGPGGRGNRGGGMMYSAEDAGLMHDEMVESIAAALGISVDEFETRREAGESMFAIADSLGVDFEALTEAMNLARSEAMEQAYADGTISQEHYEFFLERGTDRGQMGGGYGGRHGGGGFNGECPYTDTDS